QVKRLHLADELGMARGEDGALPREVIALPAEHVAEEPRRLVVEVVSRREDVELTLARRGVEIVALHRAARGARGPSRERRHGRHREAVLFLVELDDAETKPARAREALDLLAGTVRVGADAEPEIEALGVVAEVEKDVPEREAVLPARDGDQEALRL